MLFFAITFLILNAANVFTAPAHFIAPAIDEELTKHGLDFVRCLDGWMDAGFSIGKNIICKLLIS